MNATFDTIVTIVGCLGYGAACIAGALLVDRINQRDIRIARVAARYRIEREDAERETERLARYCNEDTIEESGVRCVDEEEPITQRTVAQ